MFVTTTDPVSNTGPVGTFEYCVRTDAWTWSEALFSIHGFAPGDVVPTTELLLSHKYPTDRESAAAAIAAVKRTGTPFVLWHRIVDAAGAHRRVITIGAGELDERGAVAVVRGQMLDVTDAVRAATAREVEEALEGVTASRDAIDQVKGALMITYGIDADTAFALLRRYSQTANVKVREVARDFVESLAGGSFPAGSRDLLDRLADSGPHDA